MDKLDELLEHAGTKGMKWGVRKADKANSSKKEIKTSLNSMTSQRKFSVSDAMYGGRSVSLQVEAVRVAIKMVKKQQTKKRIAKAFDSKIKDFNKKDLKNAANMVSNYTNVRLTSNGKSVDIKQSADFQNVLGYYKGGVTMDRMDEMLQHAGVKGMKWGVIRSASAKAASKAGKVATSGAKKVAESRVGKEVGSVKREMQWNKVLKDVHKMTTSEIGAKSSRLQQENDIKRMSSAKNAKLKERPMYNERRKIYLNRGKMSDAELKSAVDRMRVEDSLKRNVDSANSVQKALGKKIVSVASPLVMKYALGEKIESKDITAAFKNDVDAKTQLRNQIATSAGKKAVEIMAKRAGAGM